MMYHDHAVSNGHLFTPCHVDFNSKDSYIVTNDVIVLMAFGQGNHLIPVICHIQQVFLSLFSHLHA